MDNAQLWSEHDELCLETFTLSRQQGDMLGALMAIEGVGQEQAEQCRQDISTWGEQVCDLAEVGTPTQQASALKTVLVETLGFTGVQEDYYHPDNSHITKVLKRRQGLPIMLSGVWSLVGEYAEFDVRGVGMPGHFIIQVGGTEGLFVDPFHEGKLLSIDDCQEIVHTLSQGKLPWDEDFLLPISTNAFLERVLRNLMNSYLRHQDTLRFYRAIRFLSSHQPDTPELQITLGQIEEALDDLHRAQQTYEAILARFPTGPIAEEAAQGLQRIRRAIH